MSKMRELLDSDEYLEDVYQQWRDTQNKAVAEFVSEKKQGTKYDDNKLDVTLVPRAAIESIARALSYGAVKYGRDNYKLGIDEVRIKAALMRHLLADLDGELTDSESGLQHMDHVAACIAMWAFQRSKS